MIPILYMQKLEMEVAQLQAANGELMKDKQEALPLLQAYRSVTLCTAHTCRIEIWPM